MKRRFVEIGQNKTICMVSKSSYVQRCKQWGCWATPQLISSFLCFCRFSMVDDHWSCTVINEIVSIDRPSEYYLLSNRVILSLSNAQAPSIVRPTTRRHRGSVADICLLRQESPRWTLCDFVFVVRALQIVSEADICSLSDVVFAVMALQIVSVKLMGCEDGISCEEKLIFDCT